MVFLGSCVYSLDLVTCSCGDLQTHAAHRRAAIPTGTMPQRCSGCHTKGSMAFVDFLMLVWKVLQCGFLKTQMQSRSTDPCGVQP